jgi:hypothetical protein
MKLSYSEARKKICPMAREDIYPGENTISKHCISDHCMAWRFTSSLTGYCGMAGPLSKYSEGIEKENEEIKF